MDIFLTIKYNPCSFNRKQVYNTSKVCTFAYYFNKAFTCNVLPQSHRHLFVGFWGVGRILRSQTSQRELRGLANWCTVTGLYAVLRSPGEILLCNTWL